MDDQMGHSGGLVQARYAHATTDMVRSLLDGRPPSPGSPVAMLDGLLRDKIVSRVSPWQHPETERAGPLLAIPALTY